MCGMISMWCEQRKKGIFLTDGKLHAMNCCQNKTSREENWKSSVIPGIHWLKDPSVPKCNYSQDFSELGESWVAGCSISVFLDMQPHQVKAGWEWGESSRCSPGSLGLCCVNGRMLVLQDFIWSFFLPYAFRCEGWKASSKHLAIVSHLSTCLFLRAGGSNSSINFNSG